MSKGRRTKHQPRALHGNKQLIAQRRYWQQRRAINHCGFIWINHRPYSMMELGDLGKLTLTELLHFKWNQLPAVVQLPPMPDDAQVSLQLKFAPHIPAPHAAAVLRKRREQQELRDHCMQLVAWGAFTEHDRNRMIQMDRDLRMLEALCG